MSMQGDLLQEAKQDKLFALLLKREENQNCADCQAKAPTWVSLDFGVFVCMNCSGAHRHLSRSVTRVYSTKIDRWNTANYQIMDYVGNKVANDYWEFKKPPRRIALNAQPDERVRFVTEKYVRKLYCNPKEQNPVSTFIKNREQGILKRPITSNEDTIPPPNIQIEGEKVFISNGAATNQHVIQIRKEQQEIGNKQFNSVTSPSSKQAVDLLDMEDEHQKQEFDGFADFVSAPQMNQNSSLQNSTQSQPAVNNNQTNIYDLYNKKTNSAPTNVNPNQNQNGSNLNALYQNGASLYPNATNYQNTNGMNQNNMNQYQYNNANQNNVKQNQAFGISTNTTTTNNVQGRPATQPQQQNQANTNVDLMSLYNKNNTSQNPTIQNPVVPPQQQQQPQIQVVNNDIVVDKNRYQALNHMNQMGQYGNYNPYYNMQYQNYNLNYQNPQMR